MGVRQTEAEHQERMASKSIEQAAWVTLEKEFSCSTIDLMRHRTEVIEGTMDFLFISLFLWAKEQGFEGFNLGLSALSGVGEKHEDPAVERALHYICEHINQFYNFKGLHHFKEKFHPRIEMRYLIFPSPANLPAITLTLIRADSGDNFLQAYIKDWWRNRRLATMT
ncbi:MAG: DUF2156 domain-containing protein [Anaerolineales bacterium]|nr:MAG: DUF2156 domain-containing protein [Anaerolineales bacterium]